jgi:hypothetical protein
MLSTRIPCAIPNLLLKYPDTTLAIYKRRQMKHLKHAPETLEKQLKTLENHCKHMQHSDKTIAIYV